MRMKSEITWNYNLAYAVGLLATDGNLSSDGRHMALVSKDIEQIKTFKRCLGINNKISRRAGGYIKNRKYYSVQFGNINLYKWLQQIGLTPRKTKTISKLFIPDKYLVDYLRGYIDGDGYIRTYQDPIYPNSQRLYTRFISASLSHLLWLQKRIFSLLKIKGHRRQHTKSTFELSYAKNESKILLNAIYYNRLIPCLKRKRKIAEPFLLNK